MGKSIAVVGGGIAGLGAARILLKEGCDVTLFEARPELGGRIRTILEKGIPLELGAEFVHGENQTLLSLLEEAGIAIEEARDRHQFWEKGTFREVDFWEEIDKVISQVDPQNPDTPFSEFAADLDRFERQLALGFVEGFHAAPPRKISAHSLRRAEYSASQMEGSSQYRVSGGYGALIQFLERQIRNAGAAIHTGTAVDQILWEKSKATLRVNGGAASFTGNAAILAVPLPVLQRHLKIEPQVIRKQEAIEQMKMGNVVKVILKFSAAWWPEPDFGFIHALEEPIPTWWSMGAHPVLVGWAGGPKSEALRNISSDDLRKVAVETVGKIFNRPPPADALESFHALDWASDPCFGGSYSYIPVNGLDLPKLLAEPVENTLFFAGEATVSDAQTGTVFGALESGLRAAREVLKFFAQPGGFNLL